MNRYFYATQLLNNLKRNHKPLQAIFTQINLDTANDDISLRAQRVVENLINRPQSSRAVILPE